jgi:cytochrome P450
MGSYRLPEARRIAAHPSALSGGFVAVDARKISWWDTLRLQIFVTVPAALWGLVAANRLFVSWLARWDAGRVTARFLDDLRQKYQCDRLWLWFPWRCTLLVLDRKGIDAVLASEANAADPPLKKHALSKSFPEALTLSSGDEWSDRRRFNEAVLGFGEAHRHRDAFKDMVFREVEQWTAERSGALRWTDFQALGQRVSHQVLLGPGQVEPEMTAQLARMLGRSNWPFLPRPRRCYSAFYERIEEHLARHRPGGASPATPCLMHDSARLLEEGSATASTRVPAQIGFWFFVLHDAVELHAARTLALIAAHAQVQDRVREEIRKVPTLTAHAIDGLRYLEACLSEQLRLWTPVPILLRRALKSFSLPDEVPIEAGQQILMHTGFYHRDSRVFGETAHQFSPDRLGDGSPRVYFFSGGRQSCAGQLLARFILKATLARLLHKFRFELVGPRIGPGPIPYLYDHFKIELRLLEDA